MVAAPLHVQTTHVMQCTLTSWAVFKWKPWAETRNVCKLLHDHLTLQALKQKSIKASSRLSCGVATETSLINQNGKHLREGTITVTLFLFWNFCKALIEGLVRGVWFCGLRPEYCTYNILYNFLNIFLQYMMCPSNPFLASSERQLKTERNKIDTPPLHLGWHGLWGSHLRSG